MKIAFLTPEYPHRRAGTSRYCYGKKIWLQDFLQKGCTIRKRYWSEKKKCFIDNGIWPSTNTECEIERIVVVLTKKLQKIITIRYTDKEIDLARARVDRNYFIYFQNCPVVIRLNGSDYLFL
jgi:hypothetical protein